METLLLTSLILLSFSISSFALSPSEAVVNAAEILSDSGYLSMSLTLQLVSQSILPQSSTVMIFAPSDDAFARSGQPPLLQLQYQISPLRLSIESLKALHFGTTIPTLLLNHSLIVTSSASNAQLSINDVTISEPAIYDDGSVVIYGMEEFFNSSFQIYQSSAPEPGPSPTAEHGAPIKHEPSGFDINSFVPASDLLRSRGYSKMATFLDMQLAGFTDQTKLTIFAPVDGAIDEHVRNFSDYSLIFRRHIVPNWMTWTDLIRLNDGTMLPTFLEGFMITVTRSGDVIALNGAPVVYPDMYNSDGLSLHGLHSLLMSSAVQESTEDSFFEFDGNIEHNQPDYGES